MTWDWDVRGPGGTRWVVLVERAPGATFRVTFDAWAHAGYGPLREYVCDENGTWLEGASPPHNVEEHAREWIASNG